MKPKTEVGDASLRVLVVGAGKPAKRLRAILERGGFETAEAAGPDEALRQLRRDPTIGVLFVPARGNGIDGARFLSRVHRLPFPGPPPSVVLLLGPGSTIAAGIFSEKDAVLLSAAAAPKIVLEAADTAARRHVENRRDAAERRELAGALEALRASVDALGRSTAAGKRSRASSKPPRSAVRLLARIRRAVLGENGDGADPSWDMLCALAGMESAGRPVSVSTLIAETRLSPSTAHRCLARATEDGLIERVQSEADGRVVLVKLTRRGQAQLDSYAARVLSAFGES